MEDRLFFTQELIDAWSAKLDEQAWWILIEQLKETNALEMQEFGQDAFKILEVLEDVEAGARLDGMAPSKLDELAKFQATIRAQSVAILQAHESLAIQVQQAEDGMDGFKTLFLAYDVVRTEHKKLIQQCEMERYEARDEVARQKMAALDQADEILREAQRQVDAMRRGSSMSGQG